METKPGIKTSEFWIIIASLVINILQQVLGLKPTPEITLPPLSYLLSRTVIKAVGNNKNKT